MAPFAGEAEEHKAAYALVVPRRPAVTFGYLASQLLATDPKTLPWMQLAPIGGGLLLALIIGFVLMRIEAIGPAQAAGARVAVAGARRPDAARRRPPPGALRDGGARGEHDARSAGLVGADVD